jgi:hypothetical protein
MRIVGVDDKGERQYMDDAQRAQEAARTRDFVQEQCQ